MNEAWPQGIFCEFGAGVVPLQAFLALPEVRALDVWAVIEQDRVAVTVADMPVVARRRRAKPAQRSRTGCADRVVSREAVVLGRVGIDLLSRRVADAAARGAPLHALRRRVRRQPVDRAGTPRRSRGDRLARRRRRSRRVRACASSRREGVDCRFLAVDPEWRTPPTFCEIWPPDDFPLTFYRRPTAPDWQLAAGRLRRGGGRGRAGSLRDRHRPRAVSQPRDDARCAHGHRGGTIVFDLDWRPSLWDDPGAYPELAREAAALADVVVGNRDEVAAAGGLDAVLELAPTVILKRGGDGAVLYDDGEIVDVPGVPVEVVNGLGAGDAFGAALGYAIARGIGLRAGVELANRAGAHVAQRIPCSEAMPRLADLQEVSVS